MSNIIKSEDDILFLQDFISYVYENDVTKEGLESFLYYFVPRNYENPINFKVLDKGFVNGAFFPMDPQNRYILFSINKVKEWIRINTKIFSDAFPIKDLRMLRCYLLLYVASHEIEHAYQSLIAKGEYPCYNVVRELYNSLFFLLEKKYFIIPRPILQTRKIISSILYKRKEDFYVLERNANIFSTDLLCQCAYAMGREDLLDLFFDLRNFFLLIGYENNFNGSFEETYESILMSDKFNRIKREDDVYNTVDRAIFGLSIDEEVRDKILRKEFFDKRGC